MREYMLEHLQELMEDVETYGWKVVRDYHAAWLQLLEQGRAAWGDRPRKDKLLRLLVWNKPVLTFRQATAPAAAPARSQAKTQPQQYRSGYGYLVQPAKPGDRACSAYNRGACLGNASHPLDQHVCAYCLRTTQKLCKHVERDCRWKEEAKNGGRGVWSRPPPQRLDKLE